MEWKKLEDGMPRTEPNPPVCELPDEKIVLSQPELGKIIEKVFIIGYFNNPDFDFWDGKPMEPQELKSQIELTKMLISSTLKTPNQ